MIEDKLMENFADGITKLSNTIVKENPDLLIYPIRGAVPIVDFLKITNPEIGTYDTEYMPSSSSISNTDEIILNWSKNAYKLYHVPGENLKIVTIDEIKSGNSVSRALRRMKQARRQYRLENNLCRNDGDLNIKSIGLLDLRFEKEQKHRGNKNPYQKPYLKLLENKEIIPIPVNENIVMDRPEYCPLILQRDPNNPGHFLPKFKEYRISIIYLDLLKQFASIIGQKLDIIYLQNPEQIRNSERFLK